MAKAKTSYQELKDIWYEKLKQDGFEDIEHDEDHLKSWASDFKRARSLHSWQAKASYYYMAEHFLREHRFKSKKEKIIWEYHSNGTSIRNIVLTLKKVNIESTRQSVWETLSRLEKLMKKKYMRYDNE